MRPQIRNRSPIRERSFRGAGALPTWAGGRSVFHVSYFVLVDEGNSGNTRFYQRETLGFQTVWLDLPEQRLGVSVLPSRSCLHHPFRRSIWHVGIPCKAIVQPTPLTGNRNGNTQHWLQTADCRVFATNDFEDRGPSSQNMLQCCSVS